MLIETFKTEKHKRNSQNEKQHFSLLLGSASMLIHAGLCYPKISFKNLKTKR
jgi:hypothetical protein